MNIGKFALIRNDSGEQVSPISEGFMEIWIIYTLQENNLTTQRMHGLSNFTYGYLSLSLFEVKIATLHSGWNIGSTVIPRRTPLSRATSLSLQQPPWSSGYGLTKQIQKLLGSPGSDDQSLTDTGGGYYLRALNLALDHFTLPI
jgi:hypothetical protein